MKMNTNMPHAVGPANSQMLREAILHTCPTHGRPTKRASCRTCNAAYQRSYLQRRRVMTPAKEMWRRSRERARQRGIQFEIPDDLAIPEFCPVLGLALTPGGQRSAASPSLDRIDPDLGYILGNVRVISDRANRLKSNRSLEQLQALALAGSESSRDDYAKIAKYVDREMLLREVRRKAQQDGSAGEQWQKIAVFLETAFQRRPA